MSILRVILWDQLSMSISSLRGIDKARDLILLCELDSDATYVSHHKKKLVLLFSAMRHFSEQLCEKGYNTKYVKLDDIENTGCLSSEIERFVNMTNPMKVVVTQPGEYRVLKNIESCAKKINTDLEILSDDRYLASLDEFAVWANEKKQLRMEFFYREMRKKHNILMENGKPVGGKWNYDSENRKFPKSDLDIPKTYHTKPTENTQEVIRLVSEKYSDHFGNIEPFHFAVTRKQALSALRSFIKYRLEKFGDYQDAMLVDEPWLYHSHISFYLNCGLLLPLECVRAAEDAYYSGAAPLNAVEGFIRQIMGWREFVRGIYWLKIPAFASENFFNAKRKLPNFYWSANTKMNCLRHCVNDTIENAYAHHIQRLMVLGNFALLTGIHPDEVNEWFLIVYADAFEWVEMPNVTGMILFADGGYLASKPYAAGGSYINKMSNYCKSCHYKVSLKQGREACPFNYLYWNFLIGNRKKLEGNPRLGMMYKTIDNMSDEKIAKIKSDSKNLLNNLDKY